MKSGFFNSSKLSTGRIFRMKCWSARPRSRLSAARRFQITPSQFGSMMSSFFIDRAISSIFRAGIPPAVRAATRDPMLVPIYSSGSIPRSSIAFNTPIWARPLMPPPPRTTDTFFPCHIFSLYRPDSPGGYRRGVRDERSVEPRDGHGTGPEGPREDLHPPRRRPVPGT